MKRKLKYAGIRAKKMLFMMLDQFSDPFYQGVAAQIAFSLFLSIVPIFILMSQLLGLFSLPLSEVSKWINENVTMEGADALLSLLEYSPFWGKQFISGGHSPLVVLQSPVCHNESYQLYSYGRQSFRERIRQRPAEIGEDHTDDHIYHSLFSGSSGIRRTHT